MPDSPLATTPTFTFASAVTDEEIAGEAINRALATIAETMTGPVEMAVVFITPHHRDQFDLIARRIETELSPRTCVGAMAGGVIGTRRELETSPGLSLLVAKLPGANIATFDSHLFDTAGPEPDPSRLNDFVDELIAKVEKPNGLMLLADPFSSPMSNLLPALSSSLPALPIVGGMASGSRQPDGNRLLIDGHLHTSGAVGIAFGGAAHLDCTVSQGCRPIGKPFVITKAKRNIIMELAGQSALEVAREMLEQLDDGDRELLQGNGWLVGRVINEYQERFGRGDFLIRPIIGLDPKAGYVAIGDAQVRVGQTIQFHVRDERTAREDFAMLLEAQKLYGPAAGALLFSCNGRGTHLFSNPNADAVMVADALGDVPVAGFFAAGEIGPIGEQNFLHGHTASMAVVRAYG